MGPREDLGPKAAEEGQLTYHTGVATNCENVAAL